MSVGGQDPTTMPAAQRALTDADWHQLDAAFAANQDPLTGQHPPSADDDGLFALILRRAPAPVGLG